MFFIIFLEKEPFLTKNILKWAINGQLKDDTYVFSIMRQKWHANAKKPSKNGSK